MAEDDFRMLLDERHRSLMTAVNGLNAKQDQMNDLVREQNGRMGKVETRLAVLEERSPGAPAKTGAISGGVAAGALTAIVAGIKALFGG